MNTPTLALPPSGPANKIDDVEAKEVARLRDTGAPIRLGFWALVVGLGLFLAWAAWAPLDEGVPAQASVAVETRRTTIQHMQGGVVRAVQVKDGSEVKVDDVLIELDDSIARATHQAIRQTYLSQRAQESRLLAELTLAPSIDFHPDLLDADDTLAAQHRAAQTQLFNARRTAYAAEVSATEQMIAGLEGQITGVGQLLVTRRAQQTLQSRQLEGVQQLAEEGFAPRNQALQLQQAQADLRTSIGNLEIEVQRLQSAVAENKLRLASKRQERAKEASAMLADIRREVQANQERLLASTSELGRMQIKSPAAGQVIGLAIRNPGGVVQPGQPLMDILPRGVPLVLDVKIPPHVIANVVVGQEVEVRFAAFASTPHLVVLGRLLSVAGDVVTEQHGGVVQSYYTARVELTPEGMKALGNKLVQPGMNADVLIRTGERSMLDYLLAPLLKRVSASMTEQ